MPRDTAAILQAVNLADELSLRLVSLHAHPPDTDDLERTESRFFSATQTLRELGAIELAMAIESVMDQRIKVAASILNGTL